MTPEKWAAASSQNCQPETRKHAGKQTENTYNQDIPRSLPSPIWGCSSIEDDLTLEELISIANPRRTYAKI